jgi:hypothetical protein
VIGDLAACPMRPLRAQLRRHLGEPEAAVVAVGIAWLVGIAYRQVLWLVIAINAGKFLIGTAVGWLAGSVALQADAPDLLGDSLTYAISLLVIGRRRVGGHQPRCSRASRSPPRGSGCSASPLAACSCWMRPRRW